MGLSDESIKSLCFQDSSDDEPLVKLVEKKRKRMDDDDDEDEGLKNETGKKKRLRHEVSSPGECAILFIAKQDVIC